MRYSFIMQCPEKSSTTKPGGYDEARLWEGNAGVNHESPHRVTTTRKLLMETYVRSSATSAAPRVASAIYDTLQYSMSNLINVMSETNVTYGPYGEG